MHSTLIDDFLEEIKACDINDNHKIIDLACGEGRNGLFLAKKGLPVIFADHSESALQSVRYALNLAMNEGEIWPVNFEQDSVNPLANKQFAVALVFRYLHRPLMPVLLESIAPSGLVIYETFTVDNKQFGRPNRSDFLLKPGELKSYFSQWQVLHYFEGVLTNPDRAVAQIVCRKPASLS